MTSNSTEEIVEEEETQIVEEVEEEVPSVMVDGRSEPIINLSTYNPFEVQSNFAGVELKPPSDNSK